MEFEKQLHYNKDIQCLIHYIRTRTLNVINHVKVSNLKYKLKHCISNMVICGSYISEFSIGKDMKKKKKYNNEGRWR